MTDAESLLKRARAYAETYDVELTTLSKRLFKDHRRLSALASGESFLRPPTLRAALAIMAVLEANPPHKLRNPEGASNGEQHEAAHAAQGSQEAEGQSRRCG